MNWLIFLLRRCRSALDSWKGQNTLSVSLPPRQKPTFKAWFRFFLLALVVWYGQSQLHPIEKVLGLAHGQIIEVEGLQVVAFDNISESTLKGFNTYLIDNTFPPMVAISSSGQEFWRFCLGGLALFGLCYQGLLILLNSRLRDFKFPEKLLWEHRGDIVVLFGGYLLSYVHSGPWATWLFITFSLLHLVGLAGNYPRTALIAIGLKGSRFSRALWAGWLLGAPSVSSSRLNIFPSEETEWVSLLGWILLALCPLISYRFSNRSSTELSQKSVFEQCRLSQGQNQIEVVLFSLVLLVGILSHPSSSWSFTALYAFSVSGAFAWGRVLTTCLTQATFTAETPDHSKPRVLSLARICTVLWFVFLMILSVLYYPLNCNVSLMGLLVAVPLVLWGRPWTRPRLVERDKNEDQPDFLWDEQTDSYKKWTGLQKTAIFMRSIPPEASAELLAQMSPQDRQAVVCAAMDLPEIGSDTKSVVVEEYCFLNGLKQSDIFTKPVRKRSLKGSGTATFVAILAVIYLMFANPSSPDFAKTPEWSTPPQEAAIQETVHESAQLLSGPGGMILFLPELPKYKFKVARAMSKTDLGLPLVVELESGWPEYLGYGLWILLALTHLRLLRLRHRRSPGARLSSPYSDTDWVAYGSAMFASYAMAAQLGWIHTSPCSYWGMSAAFIGFWAYQNRVPTRGN